MNLLIEAFKAGAVYWRSTFSLGLSAVKVVDEWLIANGAVPHESVVIHHWW